MGKAKRLGFNSIISDIDLFTDREQHRELFLRKLKDIAVSVDKNNEEFSAIFFHGLAGIGKSFLLNYLKYQVDHLDLKAKQCPEFSGKTIHSVFCDFEKVYSRRDIIMLLMTTMVSELGFSFPLTAAALLRTSSKEEDNDWKHDSFADKATGSRSVGIVVSLLKCFAPFGNMLSLVEDLKTTIDDTKGENDLWRAFDKALKNTDDRRLLNYIRSDMNSVQTIDRNLHEYFSYDIRRNINDWKDKEKGPIVIFLDTFEFYQDKLKMPGSMESILWLQEIISSVPYVLWVISGREKLYEYLHGSEWEDCGIEQIAVERFEKEDVSDYLVCCGITDPEVHEKFFELSGGIPYLLRLLRERYEDLRQNGKERSFGEYGKNNGEIVDRYLRYLKSKDNRACNLLYQLSLFRDGWTEGMIETMKGDLEYYDKSVYNVVCRDSVVEHCGDGSYRIQRSIREIIEMQAIKEMPETVKKTTKLLKDYYRHEVESMGKMDPVTPMIRLLEICEEEEKKALFTNLFYDKLKSSHYQIINNADKVLEMLKPVADKESKNKQFLYDYLDLLVEREALRDTLKAYDICKNNLELWKSRFGEESLDLLDKKAEMADRCVYVNNNVEEAIKAQENCYHKSVEVLGDNHPDTLERQMDLAFSYRHRKREDAYQTLKDCMQRCEYSLGDYHKDTIEKYYWLARFCCYDSNNRDKCEESVKWATICFNRSVEAFGEYDMRSLNALGLMIRCDFVTERKEEALYLAESYSKKLLQKLGENHVSYLCSLEILSDCYLRLGRSRESLSLLEDCCNRSTLVLGECNSYSIRWFHKLASLYKLKKRTDDAIETYKKCYQALSNIFGEYDIKTLHELHSLARSYYVAGKLDEAIKTAEDCYQKSIRIMEYSLSLQCLRIISDIQIKMGRYGDVLSRYENHYAMMTKEYGVDHPDTLDCQNQFESFLSRLGKQQEATEVLEDYYSKTAGAHEGVLQNTTTTKTASGWRRKNQNAM